MGIVGWHRKSEYIILSFSIFRLIFWTDWGQHPAISRARMDGSSVTQIITTGLHYVNGITIDHDTLRLYWVDASFHRLESCDVNGHNRRVIVPMIYPTTYAPFDVVLEGRYVYWSIWYRKEVYRVPKSGTSDRREDHISVIGEVEGVRLYGFTIINTKVPRPGGEVLICCCFC